MASRMEACKEGKKQKGKRKGWAGLIFLGLCPLWFGLLPGCSEANSQLVARPEPRAAAPAQPPAFPPPPGDAKGPDLPPDPGTKQERITPVAAPPAASTPLEPAVFRPEQAVNDPEARIRELQRLAAEHYAAVDSYIVRLRRREQVGGKDNPEELLLCRFRKQPFSVYFKWIGKEGNGREVVYVQGRHDDKIHTRMAAGDMLLMPAGSAWLCRRTTRSSVPPVGIQSGRRASVI